MKKSVSVGTWNIGGGFKFDKKIQDGFSYETEDLDYFISHIPESKIDILSIQEAHSATKPNTDKEHQIKTIGEALNFNFTNSYPYGPSHIKAGNLLSLGNVTRFSIIDSEFYKLPNPNLTIERENGDIWKSFDVGFLVSKIDFLGTEINLINGHMVPFHYFEKDFMDPEFDHIRDAITEILIETSDLPTIIATDFNYPDIQTLLPKVFQNNLFYSSFNNQETAIGKGQQDHILFSNHWSLIDYKINSNTRSDHFMCISEIQLRN